MIINCCKTHVEHALDVFVAKTESYPILTELSDEKSYPQSATTVKKLQRILWRTLERAQHVESSVDMLITFVGNLFVKRM